MLDIDGLIRAYWEQQPSRAGGEAFPGRTEIIRELEPYWHYEQVTTLFLDVLRDATHYDLARIEVLKILNLRGSEGTLHEELGIALRDVATSDDDDLVRQYAMRALANYLDVPGVVDTLERTLADPLADIDLRFNALSVFERVGLDDRRRSILLRLVGDPELGLAVKDVLREAYGNAP